MGNGPWDLTRAGMPGRNRFLASDADRERAIDLLKTAFVQGTLTRDELAARTGRALQARTYGQLAAVLTPAASKPETSRPARPAGPERPAGPAEHIAGRTIPPSARRRVSKKVLAWGACAIILPPALAATFLSYYGGFLVMMLFTFIGVVVTSKPPSPRRPGRPG